MLTFAMLWVFLIRISSRDKKRLDCDRSKPLGNKNVNNLYHSQKRETQEVSRSQGERVFESRTPELQDEWRDVNKHRPPPRSRYVIG